jgi:hypothetical protein
MTKQIRGAVPAALAIVATSVAAPVASAAPVTVDVRVEGATHTIFEGPVTTDVHQTVTPTDGQPRTCDGSSVGNPPGPTAIGALDDAARTGGFVWDARWDPGFNDYYPFLRIGADDIDASSHFLALFVNWNAAQVGGCGQRVGAGDQILWAYEDFNESPILRLHAPATARTGEAFGVRVVDGLDDSPEAAATVGGATTGADGSATLSFADAGVYRLKAEKPDAIRSNAQVVCVDPAGADPCTSGDKSAPQLVRIDPPGKDLASERGRSRTMVVSWQADDGTGAGVAYYVAEVREVGSGLRASQAEQGEWRTITDRTATPSVRFRGESGKAYRFRITAVDRATNRGTAESNTVLVPVDDRDRRLLRFSRGWQRTPRESAWGETVRRTTDAGRTAMLRFRGRRVSLISRRIRKGGRLRVTVGKRSKVVNLRGRSGARRVLWTSRRMREGAHVLRIRSLGGGPVEVDAVAPRP